MKGYSIYLWYLLFLAFVVVSVLCLTGCKTVEYVPVEKVKIEYKTKTDTFIQKDSLVLHDSVYIHARNDTVFFEKWHTKYVDRWKEKVVTDSFVKVDSIPVPYEVPAKLTRWQSTKVLWGGYAMVFSFIIIVIGILFVILKVRRRLGA